MELESSPDGRLFEGKDESCSRGIVLARTVTSDVCRLDAAKNQLMRHEWNMETKRGRGV